MDGSLFVMNFQTKFRDVCLSIFIDFFMYRFVTTLQILTFLKWSRQRGGTRGQRETWLWWNSTKTKAAAILECAFFFLNLTFMKYRGGNRVFGRLYVYIATSTSPQKKIVEIIPFTIIDWHLPTTTAQNTHPCCSNSYAENLRWLPYPSPSMRPAKVAAHVRYLLYAKRYLPIHLQ